MGGKKTKHKEGNNNVMAEAPLTCNPANARRWDPLLERLQRVWFGGVGKKAQFQYLTGTFFRRNSVGKASLPKLVVDWLGLSNAC